VLNPALTLRRTLALRRTFDDLRLVRPVYVECSSYENAGKSSRRAPGRAIVGREQNGFWKISTNHQVWQVHADTHYEPLLIAYRALASGQTQDPFVEQDATVRRCLNLTEELRHLKTTSHKHLYIYGESSSMSEQTPPAGAFGDYLPRRDFILTTSLIKAIIAQASWLTIGWTPPRSTRHLHLVG
jgi:hypothetical protein